MYMLSAYSPERQLGAVIPISERGMANLATRLHGCWTEEQTADAVLAFREMREGHWSSPNDLMAVIKVTNEQAGVQPAAA